MRIISISFGLLLLFAFYQCADDVKKNEVEKVEEETGASLAKIYCASCHLYPTPELLDKYNWSNFVLIRMGAFLGIYQKGNNFLEKVPKE